MISINDLRKYKWIILCSIGSSCSSIAYAILNSQDESNSWSIDNKIAFGFGGLTGLYGFYSIYQGYKKYLNYHKPIKFRENKEFQKKVENAIEKLKNILKISTDMIKALSDYEKEWQKFCKFKKLPEDLKNALNEFERVKVLSDLEKIKKTMMEFKQQSDKKIKIYVAIQGKTMH